MTTASEPFPSRGREKRAPPTPELTAAIQTEEESCVAWAAARRRPRDPSPPPSRRAPRARHAQPRSPDPARVKDRPSRPAARAARSVLEARRGGWPKHRFLPAQRGGDHKVVEGLSPPTPLAGKDRSRRCTRPGKCRQGAGS